MGSSTIETKEQKKLMSWYEANKRDLPWRKNGDPYRIWISEVMLQQTTVVAVIPFYEKFLNRFETLQELALAPESEVLKYWSGLGYYSRARNIHRAAQILAADGFSKSYLELLKIPGFGPYTSRAVSSICFEEKAGVLDGNVIRVFTRYLGLKWEWWKPKERKELQRLADDFAQVAKPSIWNQALMELGASLCTPQKPACLLCPLKSSCQSFEKNLVAQLPFQKPRRKKEIWIWYAHLLQNENKLLLVKNDYAPFLKNQWILPGEVVRSLVAPKKFDFKHMITHHEIFVVKDEKKKLSKTLKTWPKNRQWVELDRISEISPTSLVAKLVSASQS
jgi:A/G-specific adenine glycosylase